MVWLVLLGVEAWGCSLLDSLPADGAEADGVAVDIAPWVEVSRYCEMEVVRLRRYTDHELLGEWPLTESVGGSSRYGWVQPDALEPDTRYRLAFAMEGEADERNERLALYFSTGVAYSVGEALAAPVLEIEDLRLDGGEDAGVFELDILGVAQTEDLGEPALLEVRTDWHEQGQVRYAELGEQSAFWWATDYTNNPLETYGGGERELCVEGRLIGQSGVTSDWSEPVCDRVQGDWGLGCSAAGGAALGWLWLPALFFVRQRRASTASEP